MFGNFFGFWATSLAWVGLCGVALAGDAGPGDRAAAGGIDLAARYPTTLDEGDANPDHARPWTFAPADIYRLASFNFSLEDKLLIETGPADVGFGHCADGVVWAVVVPRDSGTLTSTVAGKEPIIHIWLRFHPREIARLFPPATVSGPGQVELAGLMERVARTKFNASFHAGQRAMIPERKDMTVDVDVRSGKRRMFIVDTDAATARYARGAETRIVPEPRPLDAAWAGEAFDRLWQTFDERYAMFGLRPEVDWAAGREQYRPQALAAKSTDEFASVCASLLRPLRDLHIWITVDGMPIEVYNRPRASNANPAAGAALLGEVHNGPGPFAWAVTKDQIGYILIRKWSTAAVVDACDEALEQMRSTRGLIVDVRLNGGGSEPLAGQVAGRFADREIVYAYSQFRNGPRHTDLTEKLPRTVEPRGPWRYDRPVVLLIGQKCMSSNESFVAMMGECPQVTTMGDHTCGSSGNPMMLELGAGIVVSVPQWIDLLPDGTPLDEHGVQPDVPFEASAEAFTGQRDDLLAAALERLRAAPLPAEPIAGAAWEHKPATSAPTPAPEHRHAAVPEPSDDGVDRPKVVEVSPAPGGTAVPAATELRIRFDRPMDARLMWLMWTSGTYEAAEAPRYDEQRHEFAIPIRLAPGVEHHIRINPGARDPRGFASRDGVAAASFEWSFRTAAPPPAGDAPAPLLVAVEPPAGTEIPVLTRVKLRFDGPLDRTTPVVEERSRLAGLNEEPHLMGDVLWGDDGREVTVALLFPPDRSSTLKLRGLRGAGGAEIEPIVLEYLVGRKLFSDEQAAELRAATESEELRAILERTRTARRDLMSLSEVVTTLFSAGRAAGAATSLKSAWAAFKMGDDGRYFADVSSIMHGCEVFAIGSDGKQCWWHFRTHDRHELTVCPGDEIRQYIRLAAPFGMDEDLSHVISSRRLEYLGLSTLSGGPCHCVREWDVDVRERGGQAESKCRLTTLWLDAQTYRPVRLVKQYDIGSTEVRDFEYEPVDGEISDTAFSPPQAEGLTAREPEALGEGYDHRFLIVDDGSDGSMSVRWGKQGPAGRSSSGLN